MKAIETPRIQEYLSMEDIANLRRHGRLEDLTEEEVTALCEEALRADEEEMTETEEDKKLDAIVEQYFLETYDPEKHKPCQIPYDENGRPIGYTVDEVFAEIDEMLSKMFHMDMGKLRQLEKMIGPKAVDALTDEELRARVALL
jgi:hypothetical protein